MHAQAPYKAIPHAQARGADLQRLLRQDFNSTNYFGYYPRSRMSTLPEVGIIRLTQTGYQTAMP